MIPDGLKRPLRLLFSVAWAYFALVRILPVILGEAYHIRLHAINEYGPVIHEFDVSDVLGEAYSDCEVRYCNVFAKRSRETHVSCSKNHFTCD